MTYEEMTSALSALNEKCCMSLSALPHCSNILHQLSKKENDKHHLFEQIIPIYLHARTIEFEEKNIRSYVKSVTASFSNYLDYFWPPTNNPFLHQSDFVSSIIPEMICMIFGSIINHKGLDLEVSAQKDLAIECIFGIANGGSVKLKNKRVDVAVTIPSKLVFNDEVKELPIPLIAVECKTNLDKNMISGIEHSVNELKKTFPDCCYFVVSELSDFDVRKLNYASSGIDEMYILRNQKRAVIRKNPNMRNPINPDLIYDLVQVLLTNLEAMNTNKSDLDLKMQAGRLIGR